METENQTEVQTTEASKPEIKKDGPKFFIDEVETSRNKNETETVHADSENGTDNSKVETEEKQKVTFSEEQQKLFNSKISEKVTRAKEAEAKAIELQAELDRIKQTQQQSESDIIDPEPPDILDIDYDNKIVQWKNQIVENAEKRASIKAVQDQKNRSAQVSRETSTREYFKRGIESGIDQQKLIESGNKLLQFGVKPNSPLENFILDEKTGPQITEYLAENVIELDTVTRMPDHQAISYIYKNVIPKFNKQIKKKPPTSEGLSPSGAIERTKPHLRGYKFE